MAYPIDELTKNHREVNGKWCIARPVLPPLIVRLRDAWKVLVGKADAVVFCEPTPPAEEQR